MSNFEKIAKVMIRRDNTCNLAWVSRECRIMVINPEDAKILYRSMLGPKYFGFGLEVSGFCPRMI